MDDSGTEPVDPELAALLRELSTTLERLNERLPAESQAGTETETRNRPAVADRQPPGGRELLRFTESHTIPTLLSVLETATRSLELLRAALRMADGRSPTGGGGTRTGRTERVDRLGRTTLEQLDALLGDLQGAVEEGEPPTGPAADLLADARALREEVAGRVEAGTAEVDSSSEVDSGPATRAADDGGHQIPVTGPDDVTEETDDATDGGAGDAVDVEAELETIREDLDTEQRSHDDEPGGG
jgi:hypothetical protein